MNTTIKQIRNFLKQQKSQALIITNRANIIYTSNFTGDDSWLLITLKNAYLITDSRYTQQAQKQSPDFKIIERTGPITNTIAKILNKQKSIKTVLIENAIAINIFQHLSKQLTAKLKANPSPINQLRTIKTPSQAQCIAAAGKIAIQALTQSIKSLKVGITENQFAGLIDFNIRKLNSTNSFETIVAFGPNASMPHYHPANRKLKTNDTILIDFGAHYKNYKCDITRCFIFGKPTKQYLRAYAAVRKAQQAAIETIAPEKNIAEIDQAARRVIDSFEFPQFGHGTGHGLGLDVHELPHVTHTNTNALEVGQVITIEPGIYLPGKLGIRIEDDILVTKTGYKILTPTTLKDNPQL